MIIKRDGSKVPFNKQKVINAINKALIEVDGKLYETETAEEIAEAIAKVVELNNDELYSFIIILIALIIILFRVPFHPE